MQNLKLPHRVVLLDHADPQKEKLIPFERSQNLVTFSVLTEAILMGKLKFNEEGLTIINDTPSPHSMINDLIQAVGRSHANKSLYSWVEELGVQIPFYKHVRENLVDNQVMHYHKKSILGLTYAASYSLKNPGIVTSYIQYLDEVTSHELDIRDLLCMIFLSNTQLSKVSFLSPRSDDIRKELVLTDSQKMIVDTANKL
ncbi:MAG: GPP34 family phosphoprotein [Bacteroidales bacterium]